MNPTHASERRRSVWTINRRLLVTGSVATGAATLAQAAAAQGTPGASPAASPAGEVAINPDQLLMLSANLCSGAILNPDHVDVLISNLSAEPGIESALDELMAVPWFTPEDLAATSPEAQGVARNILQYWFLGQYNGEPVENRESLFLDLASWQTLPYSTQQGACKGENYWAEEIES